jgi:hypothetical protein
MIWSLVAECVMRLKPLALVFSAGALLSLLAGIATLRWHGWTNPFIDALDSWFRAHSSPDLIYLVGPAFHLWLWYVAAVAFGGALAIFTATRRRQVIVSGALGFVFPVAVLHLVNSIFWTWPWLMKASAVLTYAAAVPAVLLGAWCGTKVVRPTNRCME